jgi:hypothetical protein
MKISFTNLASDKYTYQWRIDKTTQNPKIFLTVNFTTGQTDAKLNVAPLNNHWVINPITNRSELSFENQIEEISISGDSPEKASNVDNAGSMGENMDSISGAMSIIGAFSIALSVVSAGAPSGPIVAIIRLFKIFFRLRLVNTFFGTLLDFFLSQMGEMMSGSNYKFTDLDTQYFVNSRGKLTEHQLPVFSSFVLYDKIMIYLILKLFSITTRRLKAKVKNPDNLTTFDFYFVKLVDSFSTVMIMSGIYDFTLYCSHELLHHDLNQVQTSQTNVSYY